MNIYLGVIHTKEHFSILIIMEQISITSHQMVLLDHKLNV